MAEHLCHLAVFPVKYLKPSGTGTSKRDKKSGFYHSMLHSLVAQSIIIQWHIRPVNPSCSKSIITIYTHPVYHKLYLLESYIYIYTIYITIYTYYIHPYIWILMLLSNDHPIFLTQLPATWCSHPAIAPHTWSVKIMVETDRSIKA